MNQAVRDQLTLARVALLLDNCFFGQLSMYLKFNEDVTIPTACTDGYQIRYNPTWIATLTPAETRGLLAHEVMHVALQHHRRRGNRAPKKWNRAGDFAINPLLLDAGLTLPKNGCVNWAWRGEASETIYPKLPDEDESGTEQGQDGTDGGCGEVEDAPTGTEGDAKQEEGRMIQAAKAAKNRGKLPGSLEKLVEPLINPPLDWRTILAEFIDRSARADYTWTRPNVRYAGSGFVLPSLYSEKLQIVVAIDTSGSTMHVQDLFCKELKAIMSSFSDIEVTVIQCDAAVQDVCSLDSVNFDYKPKGFGGTSFVPVFDYISEQGMEPKALVYLTDMYGEFPQTDPGYPVLWIATSDYKPDNLIGEVVRLPEEMRR